VFLHLYKFNKAVIHFFQLNGVEIGLVNGLTFARLMRTNEREIVVGKFSRKISCLKAAIVIQVLCVLI
jgi:hypothetical protein